MSGHPDCHYCDGTGLRENRYGGRESCSCNDPRSEWYQDLEKARQKRIADLLEKEQLTDWDL